MPLSKKVFFRNLIRNSAILSFLILIDLNWRSYAQQFEKKANTEYATEITLKNLSSQFSFNSVVAEDQWMGKLILTKATVISVDDGLDNTSVSVIFKDRFGSGLICRHDRSDQEFRNIGSGNSVWILGRLSEESLGLGMTECSYSRRKFNVNLEERGIELVEPKAQIIHFSNPVHPDEIKITPKNIKRLIWLSRSRIDASDAINILRVLNDLGLKEWRLFYKEMVFMKCFDRSIHLKSVDVYLMAESIVGCSM